MKKSYKLSLGLIITVIVFLISMFFGKYLDTGFDFFPQSFGGHSIMLVLSILVIVLMRKYLSFKMELPKPSTIWKPILFAILATIVVNFLINMFILFLGSKNEAHPAFISMNPYQILVFVFIYASIAEEFLFRGFLLNILKPFQNNGITILKRHISLSVIISAIAFGLSHLITAKLGVSNTFLFQIVISTSVLGLIAGYYHEKYNNFSYAIIVHMAGNFVGVIAAFIMSLNV